jgi:NNP family nitrate/nitrite transporter-like MFS transporter
MSVLYIGTFGSFIGYSFALPLVIKNTFPEFLAGHPFIATYLAGLGFVGALVGSVARPLGGWLSDRLGGARVTSWTFLGMLVFTALLLVASGQKSFALFVAVFTVLFVLTGIGNGSVYKMIPAVYARKAETAVTAGGDAREAFLRSRRLAGAVIGIAGAIGALGGVGINMAFRASYSGAAHSGNAAFLAFLVYYALCVVITWAVYLRRTAVEAAGA